MAKKSERSNIGPAALAALAKGLLDELCTVKPGLTVGIEYDKQLAINAFNRWGERFGITYEETIDLPDRSGEARTDLPGNPLNRLSQ